MNLVQQTQHIKQKHDALQGDAAKTVNVGLTVYSQFLGTLSQRLGDDNIKCAIRKRDK